MRVSYKAPKIKSKPKKIEKLARPKYDDEPWREDLDLKIFKLRMEYRPMPDGSLDMVRKIFKSESKREAYKIYQELTESCQKLKK